MNIPIEYQNDINEAVRILKGEGCREVYLFGSLVNNTYTVNKSDIDIAIRGCPTGKFFSILGTLLHRLNHSIDLIDLDKNKRFADALTSIGELYRLA